MKVLVTGMSGLIGEAARRELEGDHELRALNRRDVPGVETIRASIDDREAIGPAFEGVDAVVHLAAVAHGNPDWDSLLPANVIGTYNVFDAAVKAGAPRVVYASSGATISGWERAEPYRSLVQGERVPEAWENLTHESPTRPSGIYGCTKVWGEALARHFSDTTGTSFICLRIGAVNADDRPTAERHKSVWCSQRDIARMIRASLEAPAEVKYDTFYVVSNNRRSYRDMTHAKEVLGFVPEESAEG